MRTFLRYAPIPILAVLTLALLCPAAFALVSTGDGGWQWQLPQPQGNDFEAVSAIDPLNAFAVGDNGTILSTSDGGATWASHDARIAGAHFNDVSFPNANDGWGAVWLNAANGGNLLRFLVHTTNGGATWTRQGSHVDAWGLDFVSATHGWACGGNSIWRTRDGGATWTSATPGSNDWYFTDVVFSDAHHGCAVGFRSTVYGSHEYPLVVATTDGGRTWQKQYTTGGGGDWVELHGVSFGDAAHGWAVGWNGTVLATSDGGTTWTPQSIGADGDLRGVDFVDAAHGWIADGTTVYATTDGGTNWTPQSVGVLVDEVSFADALNGYATGPGGDLATTTDGGNDWQVRAPTDLASPLPLLFDVTFTDPSHGCAVGQGTILTTTDGGADWASQPAASDLTSVSFADTDHGWAVGGGAPAGQFLGGGPRVILHTSDGGASWQTQFEKANTQFGNGFEDVTCTDADHAWVAGTTKMGRPAVARTTDGGASWHVVDIATLAGRMNAVSFVDARQGWAAGYGSRFASGIYRTTDGGLVWRREFTAKMTLDDLTMVDANHGWAVGGTNDRKGMCGVLKTTDGGRHWTRQDLSAHWEGMRVAFADLEHGWIACGPTVLATADGGRHWRVQRAGGYVTGLAFLDAAHGWAVTQAADWSTGGGGILTTTTGGFPGP